MVYALDWKSRERGSIPRGSAKMASVAQLVRALECGSGGRGFETLCPLPHQQNICLDWLRSISQTKLSIYPSQPLVMAFLLYGDREFWIRSPKTLTKPIYPKTVKICVHICDVIVGHNIEYDVPVILCELYRYGKETSQLESMQQFCTMKNSVEICGFDSRQGNRYPKLQELYSKLFHQPFENAHDAYCDIKATADCFWAMFSRRLINKIDR